MYSPTCAIKASKSTRLLNKRICICITGSIAAIESPKVARELIRHGAALQCVMSSDAQKIIHPNCMEYATGQKVITELTGSIEHVAISGDHSEKCDLIIVVPATSNTISKVSAGIEDTPVTSVVSTAIGSNIPIAFVPAMHISMYKNEILKENIQKLKNRGIFVLDPYIDENKAKLPSNDDIVDLVFNVLSKKDLENKKILITGGPTQSVIDPIRFITNKSSGKMGIALAKASYFRGANVCLVKGTSSIASPKYINTIDVRTYEEMYENIFLELKKGYDIVISAAAISDFTVENPSNEKLNSKEIQTITLIPSKKIIKEIKLKYPSVFVVGFKADINSDKLEEKAFETLRDASIDLIVANDVSKNDCGFESDTNYGYIVTKKNEIIKIPKCNKLDFSDIILDKIKEMVG